MGTIEDMFSCLLGGGKAMETGEPSFMDKDASDKLDEMLDKLMMQQLIALLHVFAYLFYYALTGDLNEQRE